MLKSYPFSVMLGHCTGRLTFANSATELIDLKP